MECKYPLTVNRSRKFLCALDETESADMTICTTDEKIAEEKAKGAEFTLSDAEYMLLCAEFYAKLLRFNGMLIHSSAVEYKNKAYLFSAKSGVGKSTHTHLWLKYIENTKIINDDKPAVRIIDGKYIAFGTPFSGKTDETVTYGVEIGAVVFIERAKENRIEKLTSAEALPLIMNQTLRPTASAEHMYILLGFLDGFLRETPVYRLYCDVSFDAVRTSFEELTGEKIEVQE